MFYRTPIETVTDDLGSTISRPVLPPGVSWVGAIAGKADDRHYLVRTAAPLEVVAPDATDPKTGTALAPTPWQVVPDKVLDHHGDYTCQATQRACTCGYPCGQVHHWEVR